MRDAVSEWLARLEAGDSITATEGAFAIPFFGIRRAVSLDSNPRFKDPHTRIRVNVLGDSEPRAFARKEMGGYSCNMTNGLYASICVLFFEIFASIDFFKSGRADRAIVSRVLDSEPLLLRMARLSPVDIEALITSHRPALAEDTVLAIYCAQCCFNFIWMHEVTHIWRGHCDWARMRLGLHELSEHVGPDGVLTDEYCAVLRAFEHHADLQAFNHVLTEAQRGSISAFWVTSPELRLSLTIFAVCVLGVFWHGQQKLRGSSRAHPTPMERALSFLNYSHTWHELTDKVPDMFGAKVTMDQHTWRLAEQVAHVNLAKLTAHDQFSSIVDVFSADVRQKLIVERIQLFAQLDDIVEEAMEVGPIL
jgi:hypothetical protein